MLFYEVAGWRSMVKLNNHGDVNVHGYVLTRVFWGCPGRRIKPGVYEFEPKYARGPLTLHSFWVPESVFWDLPDPGTEHLERYLFDRLATHGRRRKFKPNTVVDRYLGGVRPTLPQVVTMIQALGRPDWMPPLPHP